MIKGGQQFFSNYLRAFKDTVDKLTELVDITERNSPVYCVASDEVKDTVVGVANGNNIKVMTKAVYMKGTIKLKLYTAGGFNGESVIGVREGDIVSLKLKSETSTSIGLDIMINGIANGSISVSGGTIGVLNKAEILYTKIQRPEIV